MANAEADAEREAGGDGLGRVNMRSLLDDYSVEASAFIRIDHKILS